MIAVSETYNPYTTIRDVDMVVTFDAVSPTAASLATYSATDQQSISNLNQLNTREFVDVNYATCEDNLTKLDGTWHYLDTVITTQHIGWWTNILSDEFGLFETFPKFTATLSEEESVVGFTLHFASSNPVTECIVTTYAGNAEIYKETFTSDTATMMIDLPVSGFDKVDVEVVKTAEPYRRVKLSNFVFGITKRWNRNSILSASISEEADITGETLPINELIVEFDNSTGEFDLFGDTKSYVYKTASRIANISATDSNEIANLNQLRDDTTKGYNYATCENSLVELKGEYHYLPPASIPSSYQIGYINNTLSNLQYEYTTVPQVIYTWTKAINSSGLRLYFGEKNFATSITAEAYINDNLIDSTTIDNTEAMTEFEFAVNGYDKLVLTFNSSVEAYRFIKLYEIQILKYADSWGSYLTKNQHMEAFFVINGEQVAMGKSYLFDSLEQTNGGLTAKITAKDYVDHFDVQKFVGSHGTTTLGAAISGILTDTGITAEYYPSTLANTTVSKSAPKDTTKRAAIHYFSQAACATCTLNREGKLKIKSFDVSAYSDTLTLDVMYDEDVTKMSDYINMIRLTVSDEYTDPATEHTYWGGSGLYYREMENDCVYTGNGQTVANWLLQQASRRVYFEVKTRGNPALELGDTVRIITRDGTAYLAVVYSQEFEYDGGLSCTLKAVVGAAS